MKFSGIDQMFAGNGKRVANGGLGAICQIERAGVHLLEDILSFKKRETWERNGLRLRL